MYLITINSMLKDNTLTVYKINRKYKYVPCFNKTPEKKKKEALCELHKNAACCFEQILEAAPHIATIAQPLTSHLTNHQSKTSKTCWARLVKIRWTHNWTTTHGLNSVGWPAKTYILLALCGHWMPFRRPTKNGGPLGWMTNESHVWLMKIMKLFKSETNGWRGIECTDCIS